METFVLFFHSSSFSGDWSRSLCISTVHFFLLLSNIPLHGYAKVYLNIHSLKDNWFFFVVVVFYYHTYYKLSCEAGFWVNIYFHLSGLSVLEYNFWVVWYMFVCACVYVVIVVLTNCPPIFPESVHFTFYQQCISVFSTIFNI